MDDQIKDIAKEAISDLTSGHGIDKEKIAGEVGKLFGLGGPSHADQATDETEEEPSEEVEDDAETEEEPEETDDFEEEEVEEGEDADDSETEEEDED